MGEYATVTIWRQFEKEQHHYPQVTAAYQRQQGLTNEKPSWKDGLSRFRTIEGNLYFSHLPANPVEEEQHQLCYKWDLPPAWLLLFANHELQVIDDQGLGICEAVTPVADAMCRLEQLQTDEPLWQEKVEKLRHWLSEYAGPEDYVRLSSELVFWIEDGDCGVAYVEKEIHERMEFVQDNLIVPHWA